jgi:ribonuclease HI
MTLVTMFSDASFNRRRHIGVWAIWAKCNGTTIRHSGRCRLPVVEIGTAELMAIANGLYCVARAFDLPKGSKIIVQTDSMEAIAAIQTKPHPRLLDRTVAESINNFFLKRNIVMDLRHIKAHTSNPDNRSAVNRMCDEECRKQMTLALAAKQVEADIRQHKIDFGQEESNVIVFRNNLSSDDINEKIAKEGFAT